MRAKHGGWGWANVVEDHDYESVVKMKVGHDHGEMARLPLARCGLLSCANVVVPHECSTSRPACSQRRAQQPKPAQQEAIPQSSRIQIRQDLEWDEEFRCRHIRARLCVIV
jgi:hypothetical protein